MALTSYRTISKAAEDEYIINKSRFIGYAAPCETEEEALAFIRAIREKHRDATHNCYAYVIGANAGVMRYSDDGEPSGTAGMPMIEVLKNRKLVNLCVVVTRYFGGILLGAGGLVRAYTHSTVIAVAAAGEAEMLPTTRVLCDVPYSMWDRVNYRLASLPVLTEDTAFSTSVSFTLLIRTGDVTSVLDTLTASADGRIEFLPEPDEIYYPWPDPSALSE